MNIRIQIEGMSCEHCQRAVEKALRAVAGVEEVEVQLQPGEASVRGSADPAALVAAIEGEGYAARPLPPRPAPSE